MVEHSPKILVSEEKATTIRCQGNGMNSYEIKDPVYFADLPFRMFEISARCPLDHCLEHQGPPPPLKYLTSLSPPFLHQVMLYIQGCCCYCCYSVVVVVDSCITSSFKPGQ